MSTVYEATHRNGRRVALKVLHRDLAANARVRRRFSREGYASNKVGHPGAVAILDDDADESGNVFLVMELLEGETVPERAERGDGSLSLSQVLDIAERVLDVLAAAHENGIVHRDIEGVTASGTKAIERSEPRRPKRHPPAKPRSQPASNLEKPMPSEQSPIDVLDLRE